MRSVGGGGAAFLPLDGSCAPTVSQPFLNPAAKASQSASVSALTPASALARQPPVIEVQKRWARWQADCGRPGKRFIDSPKNLLEEASSGINPPAPAAHTACPATHPTA